MSGADPGAAGAAEGPALGAYFSRSFLVVLLVSLALLYGARQLLSFSRLDADAAPRTVAPRGDLAADEQSTVALFENASPAVVFVESRSVLESDTKEGNRTEAEEVQVPEGSGSGFVWDEEGHVVTNLHVVSGASRFWVRFQDGSVHPAQAVGEAQDFDLAVLLVDVPKERLHPLPLGRSSDLRVGQKTFAIGYPFGLEQTLTTGVVSGLDRLIRSQSNLVIHGVIQTDAAINPGNSGGPLLDSAGRLIGVNSAIETPTGVNTGVGFAIPVDTVNRIVPRILREGSVSRAGLDIIVAPDTIAKEEGIQGAVIREVNPGGPASRAGLRGLERKDDGSVALGDVIVAIDDQPVRKESDLYQALEPYKAGERVRVRFSRQSGGERAIQEVQIKLAELGRPR